MELLIAETVTRMLRKNLYCDVNDVLQRPITVLLVLRTNFDQNRNIIPKMARIDFPRTKQRHLLIVSILGKFCLVHRSKNPEIIIR